MRRSIALVVVMTAVACWPTSANALVPTEKIVFIVDRNSIFQVATVDPDGSNRTFLTTGRAASFDPQWSPDGSTIAFDRAARHESLRTMDENGTSVQTVFRLSSLSGYLFIQGLAWSPDATQLAFSAFKTRTNTFKLFTVDIGSGTTTRLSGRDDNDVNPTWSPDGTAIAVESYPGRTGVHGDIVLVTPTGSRTPLVTRGTTGDPDGSPDAASIVFTKTIGGVPDLFTVPAAGGALTRLTTTPGRFEFNPAWSPDGASIVFAKISQNSGREDLWTISADGSGATRITDTPTHGEIEPDWRA
jgi:Tol biopolymer transport system component